MALRGESYYYKIALKYINSSNTEIEIDSRQLQYIAIDRDFDNTNMPVVVIYGSIEKNILDNMIKNIDNNLVSLGIYKYDSTNQRDSITTKYLNDRFIYIIRDDISKTSTIEYSSDDDGTGTNQYYKDVTLWLIQQDAINNNTQSINGIFKNASMNSLILQVSNYLGKTLLEPIKYDTKFDQIIIPPHDSISTYLKFLNDNISVFYDTPYRFFIDFDITYIVSSSGYPVRARGEDIYTIEIDVTDIIPEDEEQGSYIDIPNNKCIIKVNTANVEYTKNNVTNKLVNKVTVIDSIGNKKEKSISNMNKSSVTSTINQIYNISNTDENIINNITYSIDSNTIMVTIVKNNLDASMFTINKEYILTDKSHEEYAGRYILTHSKQLFTKQTEFFTMTTILAFKKVVK